jgi:hypothetical protein
MPLSCLTWTQRTMDHMPPTSYWRAILMSLIASATSRSELGGRGRVLRDRMTLPGLHHGLRQCEAAEGQRANALGHTHAPASDRLSGRLSTHGMRAWSIQARMHCTDVHVNVCGMEMLQIAACHAR